MDLCYEDILTEPFVISQTTLQELEDIKNNIHKSPESKTKAQAAVKFLTNHPNLYYVFPMTTDILNFIKKCHMIDSPDNRICASAAYFSKCMVADDEPIEFLTMDLSCRNIAQNIFNLAICNDEVLLSRINKEYTGYQEVVMSEEVMADFYQNPTKNTWRLFNNEYIIIKNEVGELVDIKKWDGEAYVRINDAPLKSKFYGDVKAYNGDMYQRIAIDALRSNKMIMIKGRAGTGKSYLAMAYMMHALETHKIDKIICFCNTVATANSAKLGYYPGSRDEKLLDAQIGNFLKSKFGSRDQVDRMMKDDQIELYPMSDIRGFETGDNPCAVYITEAQNLNIPLMKLALERISANSICILDGDYNAQVDLATYAGSNNGMRRVSKVYRNMPFYGEVKLINNYRSDISNIADLM